MVKCCQAEHLHMEHSPLAESAALSSGALENHTLVAAIEANPRITI